MRRKNNRITKYWVGVACCAVALAAGFFAGGTEAFQQKSTLAAAVSSVLHGGTGTASPISSSGTVHCYFPRDGQAAQPELIDIIRSSQKTLDIAIYSFTDPEISDAIREAKQRGVSVRLITDREQSSSKSQKSVLSSLKGAGIPIKINSHSGIMHLKVTIADGKIATTGSFNYTKSAENKNDEVFVVLEDPKAAAGFEREFDRMWDDDSGFEKY